MTSITVLIKSMGAATLANLAGRAANVLIAFSIIAMLGADTHTDRFFLVMAVGFFFFGILANAITQATIPLIISGTADLSHHLTGHLTIRTIRVAGLICAVSAGLAAWIWYAVTLDFHIAYVIAIGLMCGAGIANGLATGVQYSRERFIRPGAAWAIRLLPLAAFFLAGPHPRNLPWLALGIGLADGLRFHVISKGIAIGHRDKALSLLSKLKPVVPTYSKAVAASAIMGLNPIIDRLIAQFSGRGAVSILETGERIFMALSVLCTIGMMTVLPTYLSRDAAQNKLDENWPTVMKLATAWSLLWLLSGATAAIFGLKWCLNTLTALSPAQSHAAQWVYWYYLPGLPAIVFSTLYNRRLQAQHRWWLLVATAAMAVTLNIPASLLLRHWLGVPGIALATTLITHIVLVMLIWAAHSK